MSQNVCIIYTDIVGWTTQSLTDQIATATALFTRLNSEMNSNQLTPVWKSSTGDGFVVAFPLADCVGVLHLCANLLNAYTKAGNPELRLAFAQGPIESFTNPLIAGPDYTGLAIVRARRILDGITSGNVLLIQKELAEDVKGKLSEYIKPYLVEHPDIHDKHGDVHHVVQLLPMLEKKLAGSVVIPPSMQALAASTKSEEIIRTEQYLGVKLDTIDSLIMLWMDNRPTGLDATAVEVIPKLHPTGNPDSLIDLPDLKGVFREQAAPHIEDVKRQYGPPNKPKLWLKDFKLPLSDRPTLRLTLGKTDYWTTKALELAFDSGVLRNEYESRRLNILEDLPGLTASLAIIITSDDHLILAQRKSGQVDFAGGMYSVSFDEQWDPLRDSNPYNTVLRGLSEEFNLDLGHGVHVSEDNLKLFALAREWGHFWNTVLAGVYGDGGSQEVEPLLPQGF